MVSNLNVYYPDTILNALRAARQANLATADAGQVSPEYLQGYNDALTTLALAFGLIQPPEPVRQTAYVLAVNR